jgi:hypothetical protein
MGPLYDKKASERTKLQFVANKFVLSAEVILKNEERSTQAKRVTSHQNY